MKVLIACEFSGVVRDAFAARGHDAWSCDLLPSERGGRHYQTDARVRANGAPWDLMIAHPPCTYLCNSGVCWLSKGGKLDAKRHKLMMEGCDLFAALYHADIPKVCIENPIMHKYAREYLAKLGVPVYSQTIQPWQFGHEEQKRTCLWLRGLPLLKPTLNVEATMMKRPRNERERLHYLPPSATRAMERSRTFTGIAQAMAEQWGQLIS